MHEFYAVVRDGGWLTATVVAPGEVLVHRSGLRTDVAASVLGHATGDQALAAGLAPDFASAFLWPVPDGGVPVVVRTADLLLWVVRRLREEQP